MNRDEDGVHAEDKASWVYATAVVALKAIAGVIAAEPGLFRVPIFGAWQAGTA